MGPHFVSCCSSAFSSTFFAGSVVSDATAMSTVVSFAASFIIRNSSEEDLQGNLHSFSETAEQTQLSRQHRQKRLTSTDRLTNGIKELFPREERTSAAKHRRVAPFTQVQGELASLKGTSRECSHAILSLLAWVDTVRFALVVACCKFFSQIVSRDAFGAKKTPERSAVGRTCIECSRSPS